MDDKEAKVAATSAEVVNTAATAAEAVERARQAQLEAYRAETTKALTEALQDVFGEHSSSGRFVDVSRIPLICKSILDTSEAIKRIEKLIADQKVALDKKDEENGKRFVNQDQFEPVKKVVYGVVTLILTAVVGALIALVVMK